MLFQKLLTQINNIDEKSVIEQRKIILQPLIDYINLKLNKSEEVRLNFICTHNSRRSHLAQVWAQTMAQYFNLRQVFCYSGGTESTSMYTAAVKALKQFGFEIDVIADNDNPVYSIKYSLNQSPIIGFSKCFDHPFNPKTDFAAILTCSDADEGCPFIEGADVRIPMTFEDPKVYDNTSLQSEKYIQRGLQIATELKYVFSKVNTKV
ncbi:MAG: low molecular weight phosphatase family protein [Flavobacteriaceae bacterium]